MQAQSVETKIINPMWTGIWTIPKMGKLDYRLLQCLNSLRLTQKLQTCIRAPVSSWTVYPQSSQIHYNVIDVKSSCVDYTINSFLAMHILQLCCCCIYCESTWRNIASYCYTSKLKSVKLLKWIWFTNTTNCIHSQIWLQFFWILFRVLKLKQRLKHVCQEYVKR